MNRPAASETPIDDFLDDLLRRSRSDARTTRRLLDESSDHLHATADQLTAAGASRVDAERESVRRFGPLDPLLSDARRNSVRGLVVESVQTVVVLGAVGLVAVGLSGLVAGAMNLVFGRAFVGGPNILHQGASVTETADDAVSLRVLAGVLGLIVLGAAMWVRRRHAPRVLPAGLADILAAAAFSAGALALAVATADQAVHNGADGVGFYLSGAVVALVGAGYYGSRATRALLTIR